MALEPSGPIQLVPPGLLGLLQLKSPAGQNPYVLNADVQPTMEMLGWYLRQNAQTFTGAGVSLATAASGSVTRFNSSALVVSAREWWYIHSLTIEAIIPAGDTLTNMAPAFFWDSSGPAGYAVLDEVPNGGAGAQRVWCGASDFYLPPGTEFGVAAGKVTSAATIGVTCQMRYTRLPI